MTSIQSIIVEDIPANREVLKKLLAEQCPNVSILGEAETIEEAENLIKKTNPRLVFLDIELKQTTGFDLLKKLHREGSINFETIFFTAHGTYDNATRAIKYSALDFLTKPLDPEKLRHAVEKASKKLNQKQHNAQIELLLETLKSPSAKTNRIAFHLLKGIIEFVKVDDIVYLEADQNVSYVYLQNGSKLNAMRNLGHYSKLLVSDYSFFPISHSIVVNLDYVKRYNHSELTVSLTNGKHLFASRRGGQDFKRYLNENRKNFGGIQGNGLRGVFKRLFGN